MRASQNLIFLFSLLLPCVHPLPSFLPSFQPSQRLLRRPYDEVRVGVETVVADGAPGALDDAADLVGRDAAVGEQDGGGGQEGVDRDGHALAPVLLAGVLGPRAPGDLAVHALLDPREARLPQEPADQRQVVLRPVVAPDVLDHPDYVEEPPERRPLWQRPVVRVRRQLQVLALDPAAGLEMPGFGGETSRS